MMILTLIDKVPGVMPIKPRFGDDDDNVNQAINRHEAKTFNMRAERAAGEASTHLAGGNHETSDATAFHGWGSFALARQRRALASGCSMARSAPASGALLFGAPGFVAGGVIGYAAGPRISAPCFPPTLSLRL